MIPIDSEDSHHSIQGNLGNIQITFERLPSQDDGRQHNIVSSAVRGAGRLIKNYTLEAGKLVGTVGKGVVNFGKRTTTATGEAAIDSTKRVLPASLREKLQPSDHSNSGGSEVQADASSGDNELQNTEANSSKK